MGYSSGGFCATNIAMRIERDGDEYVLNGRKWWTSNALHANCKVLIVMGKTSPDGPRHRQLQEQPWRQHQSPPPCAAEHVDHAEPR